MSAESSGAPPLPKAFQADLENVQAIAAIPKILDVVCRLTGMGYAAVARVTEDRWIACQVLDHVEFGLPAGGELKIETTLCNEVRGTREVIAIDHVAEDPIYADHHTPRIYGLQSYIAVPIMLPDGTFFGTLCAVHPKPASVKNEQVINTFKLFAELIALHLHDRQKLIENTAELLEQREMAVLREQFIAVIGHDLRNPLTAIKAAGNMLQKQPQNETSRALIGQLHRTVDRMIGLLNNLVDFARGRLGGGINIERNRGQDLVAVLEQIVAEIRAGHPERRIETIFGHTGDIVFDASRIGQLFGNLLANAIAHGDPHSPVIIATRTDNDHLTLTVANGGTPIGSDSLPKLFHPFARGEAATDGQGLGLGLYIASEIARAHGGTLSATSTSEETRFTFRMPIAGHN